MPRDDMRVIMYKILQYLYSCNKAGKTPCFEDMCHNCKMFNIPREYWAQIMIELMENGYIKGFARISTKDGITIQMLDTPKITLAGVNFLEENGTMQKVKEHLGAAFEILLSSIISVI